MRQSTINFLAVSARHTVEVFRQLQKEKPMAGLAELLSEAKLGRHLTQLEQAVDEFEKHAKNDIDEAVSTLQDLLGGSVMADEGEFTVVRKDNDLIVSGPQFDFRLKIEMTSG